MKSSYPVICVNMHGTFEDYIRGFTTGLLEQARGEEGGGREKRREGRKREREERKGEREEKKRK